MTWLLIDGNNWYARDFFASPADAATSFVAMTADKLVIDYKVNPWQWVDYQVMVGGNDSLKGCDGVGPKTAAAILHACQSLDGFYKEPFKAPITPKLRGHLLAFRSQAESLRRLVTLVDSAPLPATWLDGVVL